MKCEFIVINKYKSSSLIEKQKAITKNVEKLVNQRIKNESLNDSIKE